MSGNDSRKIQVTKRGNALGFWFFKITLKLFGLSGAYNLLYAVALHYLLFDAPARRGALAYIKQRFPKTKGIMNFLHIYRLFISQGKQLIDRFACIRGQIKFDFQINGYDQFVKLCSGRQGLILLTSHTGNWQIAMTALHKIGKPVYLVMRPEDNPAVNDSLKIGQDNHQIKIISPEQYLGGVVEIMNALSAGAIVAIMGDRHYDFNSLAVEFLGKPALFPYGAFIIAANAGCPLVILESAKIGQKAYTVNVTYTIQPRLNRGSDKKTQLQVFVQEYARILELFAQKYPYQCFLFHDIWSQ